MAQNRPINPEKKPIVAPRMVAGELLGVDVSKWQGAMNWRVAWQRGVAFAWIKATEGYSVRDARFVANARGANAEGILWGPYVFYRFSVSPENHMAALVAQMDAAGIEPTLPVAIDLEDDRSAKPDGRQPAHLAELIAERWGRPVIYTAKWWWARFTTPQPWASALPLWVADYSGPVDLPRDWTDWVVRQYTSEGNGPHYGAEPGMIDLDIFRGTKDALRQLYQGPGTKPPTKPPQPPTVPPQPEPDATTVWRGLDVEFAAHGVRLNPTSAIQTAILADGRLPVTNETEVDIGGGAKALAAIGQARGKEQWAYVWVGGRVVRIPPLATD